MIYSNTSAPIRPWYAWTTNGGYSGEASMMSAAR